MKRVNCGNLINKTMVVPNICRLCLSSKNLKTFNIPDSFLMKRMFIYTTGIKLDPADEKPQTICHYCYGRLRRSFKFRKMAVESDRKLTAFYRNGFKLSAETIPMIERKKPLLTMQPAFMATFSENSDHEQTQMNVEQAGASNQKIVAITDLETISDHGPVRDTIENPLLIYKEDAEDESLIDIVDDFITEMIVHEPELIIPKEETIEEETMPESTEEFAIMSKEEDTNDQTLTEIMPETVPVTETTEPELHNQTAQGTEPELHNQTVQGTEPELHNQTAQGTEPELHNQTVQGTEPELHNQTVQGTEPELHNQTVQGIEPELHNQTVQGTEPEIMPEAMHETVPDTVQDDKHQNLFIDIPESDPNIHPCCFCVKSYRRKCHLTRHMKSHINFIKYTSPVSNSDTRKTHATRVKKNNSKDICYRCGITFADAILKRQHLQLYHLKPTLRLQRCCKK